MPQSRKIGANQSVGARQERAAKQRAVHKTADSRRRRKQQVIRLRTGGITLALVALIVAVFVLYDARGTGANTAGIPVTQNLGPLTNTLPSGATGSFRRVSGPLMQAGKPELLFIGAQYCPFCAAERWAIVKALSRFGTWSNLTSAHSTSGESGFGGLPTFDLLHASYRSRYAVFDHKDVANNAGNTLQSLSTQEQSLFNRYDSTGGIPLIYVDGYAMSGSDYPPGELQGNSFGTVQHDLQTNAGSALVRDINAESNLLTAFVCKANTNGPSLPCRTHVIQTLESGIG